MITIEVVRGVALLGETLELTYEETLRINTSFRHRGPAQNITLSGAIGILVDSTFTDILHSESPVSVPESSDWADYTASVDILITEDIEPGTGYDIRCEILEHPEAGAPGVDDVITITGVPPPPPPPPTKAELPIWLIGLGGALVLGAVALAKPKKKQSLEIEKRP